MWLPNTWSQLLPQMVLEIAPYVLSDTIQNRLRCLEMLCLPENSAELSMMTPRQVLDVLPRLNWLYDEPLTYPVVDSFQFGQETFLLPQEGLRGCSIVEFAFAERYFDELTANGRFSKSKPNPAAIDGLILAICRPKDPKINQDDPHWEGDMREYFSPVLNKRRAASGLMNVISTNFKAFFLLYYIGCKKQIQKQFGILFKNDHQTLNKDVLAPPIHQTISPADFSWAGVIFDLAESGIFGNYEQTQYKDLHTILYYLSYKQYQYLELKNKKD